MRKVVFGSVIALAGLALAAGKDPFAGFPPVPSFSLVATGIGTGKPLPRPQWCACNGEGGDDRSPALRWSGAPKTTRSYAVTVFDPDAPGDGFWHWAVVDIPATAGHLPEGAGTDPSQLPKGAFALRNGAGDYGYMGAAPPPGSGVHRYIFSLHALDVSSLRLPKNAVARDIAAAMRGHEIARAVVIPVAGE
ncbi:MAG TPA: YbhB/YbcL family Raf kinase inhibitor-like protein [Fibrobacteria bacterium]|nr:YbhB/YbcL family Raf kinase inhibitor-like protein [Fibrobacteria bacterium]